MQFFDSIDLKKIQPEDMQTKEECAYVMDKLDAIIAQIDNQIRHASGEARAGLGYSDTQWFNDARYALKCAKRARSIAQERRGVLGREERSKEKERNIEAAARERLADERPFIEAAKRILDKETYLGIWNEAHKIKQEP